MFYSWNSSLPFRVQNLRSYVISSFHMSYDDDEFMHDIRYNWGRGQTYMHIAHGVYGLRFPSYLLHCLL